MPLTPCCGSPPCRGPTSSPALDPCAPDTAWALWAAADEARGWVAEGASPQQPINAEAAGTVARLVRQLKHGAAVVEQQERENRQLAAACASATRTAVQHDAAHAQLEVSLAARLQAAEAQLAATHAALQGAQREQRDAAAAAAELREALGSASRERDTALRQLETSKSLMQEACARAEAMASERDAARQEAHAARSDAAAAAARLRQAEALEVRPLSRVSAFRVD